MGVPEIFTFFSRNEAEKTFRVWVAWREATASRSLSSHGKHTPQAQYLVVRLLTGMSVLLVLVHVMLGWKKGLILQLSGFSSEQHLCQVHACTGRHEQVPVINLHLSWLLFAECSGRRSRVEKLFFFQFFIFSKCRGNIYERSFFTWQSGPPFVPVSSNVFCFFFF